MRSAKVWQWITTFSNVVCKQNINLTNNKQSPPDFHLVVASQQKSVSQRQTEVEDDVEEEIVPDHFVNAGLPSEQEFPEHTQACYCGHLGESGIKYLSLLIILSCLFSVGVGHSRLEKEDCRWLRTILTINWGHNNCLTSLLHWRLLADCFGRRNIVTNNWKVWLGLVQSTNLTVPLIQSAISINIYLDIEIYWQAQRYPTFLQWTCPGLDPVSLCMMSLYSSSIHKLQVMSGIHIQH